MSDGEMGKKGRQEAYLELVSHDLEGQASQGLAVIWLPGHLLLGIIHCSSLNTQGTAAFIHISAEADRRFESHEAAKRSSRQYLAETELRYKVAAELKTRKLQSDRSRLVCSRLYNC